jgi:hypothetical protein
MEQLLGAALSTPHEQPRGELTMTALTSGRCFANIFGDVTGGRFEDILT